jgi:hypothetical protein
MPKRIFTQEHKEKLRIAKLGKKLPPFSEEHKRRISEANKGNKNYNWKGDNVSYAGIHFWIKSQLGKPKKCEECGTTTAKKFEWANLSGEYKRSNGIKDWKRLCKKCHGVFDAHRKAKGEKHYLAKLTEKDVFKIRQLYSSQKYSVIKLAKIFYVHIRTIYDILEKNTWKHI